MLQVLLTWKPANMLSGENVARPIRLGQLLQEDRGALQYRSVPAPVVNQVKSMQVGSEMLRLLNIHDTWKSARHDSLVCDIKAATILSSSGIIALSSGEAIEDTLDHTDPERDGYRRLLGKVIIDHNCYARQDGGHLMLVPREEGISFRGKLLSLLLGNQDNYFHWLIMSFSRVGLLSASELDVDGILLPDGLDSERVQLIRDWAPFSKIPLLFVKRAQLAFVERLVLPWNVATGEGVNRYGVEFLRRFIKVPQSSGNLIVYLSRQKASARRLLNEQELITHLEKMNVVSVVLEEMPIHRQAEILSSATLVIAPHGAGLANLPWMPRGACVIELMSSSRMNWCYRHLAEACGLRYDCVIGQPVSGNLPVDPDSWIISLMHVSAAVLHARSCRD